MGGPIPSGRVVLCEAPAPTGEPCGARIFWGEFSRDCKCCKGRGASTTYPTPVKAEEEIGGRETACDACRGSGREHVRLPLNATRARSYDVVDARSEEEAVLICDQGLAFVSHFLTCRGIDAIRRRQGKR